MYTKRITKPNMTLQLIEPIDARIVRIKMTCELAYETDGVSDAALAFFADLLATKTKTRDKKAIISYLDRNGIQLSIDSGIRKITCTMNVARRNLSAALTILTDILRNAEVSSQEFRITQKRTCEELREARDDAKLAARINFSRALYAPGDTRRADTLDEQLATLKRMGKRDVAAIRRAMLSGKWFVSAVAHEEDHTKLVRFAAAFAHNATAAEPRPLTTGRRAGVRNVFEHVPGRTNVELRIGNRLLITQRSPDYPALAFGLSVLGDVGGFAGRLMSTVREKEGLTYGIYARMEAVEAERPGHWNIFTFFTAKDLDRGLASTKRELDLLLAKGVTERECTIFKEMYRNEFLIMHESNARRISFYHALLTSGVDEKWALAFQERIAALTVRDINEALRAHIDPKQLIISGAGPVTPKGKGIL